MKPKRWLRHFLFWTLYVLLTTALYSVQEPNVRLHLSYELASLPAKMLLVYIVIYWLLPSYILPKHYLRAGLLYAGVLLIAIFLLRMLVQWLVYPHFFPEHGFQLLGNWGKLVSPLLDLLIVSFAALAVKLVQTREEAEKRRLSLARANAEHELKLLRSQLHPHFLFNTLNGLYAQINEQPDKAAAMVVQLSRLLRYIIYDANQPSVRLMDELHSLEDYIELEKTRFSDRLDLRWSVQGDANNQRIVPLMLLPFVENCFKHGAARQNGHTSIEGLVKIHSDHLEMHLENTFDPTFRETDGPGTGLANVKKRLQHSYGNKFTLQITEQPTRFCVHLTLPLYDEMRNH